MDGGRKQNHFVQPSESWPERQSPWCAIAQRRLSQNLGITSHGHGCLGEAVVFPVGWAEALGTVSEQARAQSPARSRSCFYPIFSHQGVAWGSLWGGLCPLPFTSLAAACTVEVCHPPFHCRI